MRTNKAIDNEYNYLSETKEVRINKIKKLLGKIVNLMEVGEGLTINKNLHIDMSCNVNEKIIYLSRRETTCYDISYNKED